MNHWAASEPIFATFLGESEGVRSTLHSALNFHRICLLTANCNPSDLSRYSRWNSRHDEHITKKCILFSPSSRGRALSGVNLPRFWARAPIHTKGRALVATEANDVRFGGHKDSAIRLLFFKLERLLEEGPSSGSCPQSTSPSAAHTCRFPRLKYSSARRHPHQWSTPKAPQAKTS